MNIAALFFHNMRPGTCPAWVIENASHKDKARLEAILSKHMNKDQDAGFNEWRLVSFDNGAHWIAKRFTWEVAWGGSLDTIIANIEAYYAERR